MPYALTSQRLQRYNALFFDPDYDVPELPSYEPQAASNPFRTFAALPLESRYRFMLEEAEFTLTGFIKGPVCRGQVALDVIDDRFFVFFVDPNSAWLEREAEFLANSRQDQDLPAASGSNAWPTIWLAYGDKHAAYVQKKAEFLEHATQDGRGITQKTVWDGDGKNDNAALTVFRHFDNATVVKGLVGPPTKTVWLIDYPLLERIHYLLVAGFDVFGNVSHQLTTRLYMDYLRMEAEAGFLSLLPAQSRKALADHWYRGLDEEHRQRIERELMGQLAAPGIEYGAGDAKAQALTWLKQRVAKVARHERDIERLPNTAVVDAARKIAEAPSRAATLMPDVSFVVATDERGERTAFTILSDNGHSNITEPFGEEERRLPAEDRLVVVAGLLGAYPNAFFAVKTEQLNEFVDAVTSLNGATAYNAFRARFGVLRTNPQFWRFSDQLQRDHLQREPHANGLLDYTRLEPN